LKGDTGMLEIGFTLSPASNQPLTLDFGLQGYADKREGENRQLAHELRRSDSGVAQSKNLLCASLFSQKGQAKPGFFGGGKATKTNASSLRGA
jgi:hypothetical protein